MNMAAVITSSMTSPRPGHNPATLKFTAVKVDVSALTTRCKCKAFVISSQTTSQDLVEMVLRKLKISVKGHTNGACLLGQPPDGGPKRPLDKEERVLGFQGSKNRKTLTLELIPVDVINSGHPRNHGDHDDTEGIKSGNLSDPARNGLTLPGYHKVDANYNLAIGSGFITSTPNPELSDSLGSTVDSGFLIHYEPYGDSQNTDLHTALRGRSKSFELARDSDYNRLDTSIGNNSDSGMVVNGNHINNNNTALENGLQNYVYRPATQDGFQILQQSQHSAWTRFSRHISDSYIGGVPTPNSLPAAASVPDVSAGQTEQWPVQVNLKRRRSLPKMSLSQEQLDEKKRSVTDLFAHKLKQYAKKVQNPDKQPSKLCDIHQRNSLNREDDVMSVTSEEVADILSSASPLKPYEEDETSDSEAGESDSSSVQRDTDTTPQNVFQPLTHVNSPDPESVRDSAEIQSDPTSAINNSGDYKLSKPSLGDFVEESMEHFLNYQSTSCDKPASTNSDNASNVTEDLTNLSKLTLSDKVPHNPSATLDISHPGRGVPLFTLLTTHILAPVLVRRNQEMAPTKSIGVRVCDVSYAKCVRHVIRHWASNSRHYMIDPKLAERMLTAVGGIDRRTTVILAGKLFRGDIVVELNGKSTLELAARDVISHMVQSEVVSLVVARSRLNVERAQSP